VVEAPCARAKVSEGVVFPADRWDHRLMMSSARESPGRLEWGVVGQLRPAFQKSSVAKSGVKVASREFST
jgi:hypothetical protein